MRRGLIALAIGLMLFAGVRALVAQTVYVADSAMAPVLQVGDRVLIAAGTPARSGDLVLARTNGLPGVDRTPPMADGLVGRVIGAVGGALGLDPGERSAVVRVESVVGDEVTIRQLDGPIHGKVRQSDIIGTVTTRIWPFSRWGTLSGQDATS